MLTKPPLPNSSRQRATLPKDGTIVFVAGAPGQGKTTLLARAACHHARAEFRRVVLLDYTGDLLTRMTKESAAADRVPAEWCGVAHSAAKARELLAGSSSVWSFTEPRRVVSLQCKAKQDPNDLADEFVALMDDKGARGWVFVCDEAEEIWPNVFAQPERRRAVKFVRNRQQTLYAAVQRPQLTNTLLRANARQVVLFKLYARSSVERGTSEFGDAAPFLPALDLEKFHYLWRGEDFDRHTPLRTFDARTDPMPWLAAG